jgi:hypothetical protein
VGVRALGLRIGEVSRSDGAGMVRIRPREGPLMPVQLAVIDIAGPLGGARRG